MATIDPPSKSSGMTKSTLNEAEVRSIIYGEAATIEKFIGRNRPTNVEQLLRLLGNDRVDSMRMQIGDGDKDPITNKYPRNYKEHKSYAEFVELMKNCQKLKEYLEKNVDEGTPFKALTPTVNDTVGLHLLLANPMVARVVMEQRKKQHEASIVKAVAMPANPFGFLPSPGLTIRMHGMTGGAMEQLDPAIPVEMRGAGYAMAAMRGGSKGGHILFGTVGAPTMWRPVDDNSFISASLKGAVDHLKAQLKLKDASLDKITDDRITKELNDLVEAEKAVKKSREDITAMNNALSTGAANLKDLPVQNIDGKNVPVLSEAAIKTTVEAYNTAMKSRQKIEGKLLRVVATLGSKVLADVTA